MNFIDSNKGKAILYYGGHMYTVKTKTGTSTRWECSKRKSNRCSGFLRACINDDRDILSQSEHNHPPNYDEGSAKEKISNMKQDLSNLAAPGGKHSKYMLTIYPGSRQTKG